MTAPPSLLQQAPGISAHRRDVTADRMSAAGWSRLRRSVTTVVFVVATVAGVVIGVRAVDVSPVAPPMAAAELAAPADPAPDVVPAAPAIVPPVVGPTGPRTVPRAAAAGGAAAEVDGEARSVPRRFLVGVAVGALAAGAAAFLAAPWPIPVNAAFLAHVTGLLAGYLVAVLLVLMSRTPVLEHRIGPDTLARWHARGGRAFLILVLVHAGAAIQSWADSRRQVLLRSSIDVLSLPGSAAATVGTALFIGIAVISIRKARNRFSYETWHGVHLLTYLAIALSFAHMLAGPNLAGLPAVQIGWTLLYAYAFALVLRYRFLGPVGTLWRHRLRVVAVVPEAHGVVSLVLRGQHVADLGAESGQFFRWRFLTASTWRSAHPFSLSAPPYGDQLRITVKALGQGSTSVQSVRPGTLVFAEGPSGSMTARRRTRPSVLLIAGGVGITPMRALFETIDLRGGRLTLLYRASSAQDVVFGAELEHIARRRGAEIIWLVGRSTDPANQMTAQNFRRLVPDVAERDVYLCASPGLSAGVRTALREIGLPTSRLHEEVFSF